MQRELIYLFLQILYWYSVLIAAIVDEMELAGPISSTLAASSSIGWQYLKLYVQLCAPDDGRRNRLKHVERL